LSEYSLKRPGLYTYRKFLEELSATLFYVPERLKKDLVAFEAKIADWENNLMKDNPYPKKHYREMVGKYQSFPIQITAPLEEIRAKLRQRGLISKANEPVALRRFFNEPDYRIVHWYALVGRGLLEYYRCCGNLYKIKDYVHYMVRWSAIHTLAGKHKSSAKKIIAKYTFDLIIKDSNGRVITQFLSSQEIKGMIIDYLPNVSKDVG
jgi:hypothetical protein